MGLYYDRGRPVVGGWMGGGWVSRDDVRGLDLLWGGEFGQEGSVLFGIDVDSGEIVERHWIGAREFGVVVDPRDGTLWVHTYHGLFETGHLLCSWTPRRRQLTSHGFPPLSLQRFVSAVVGPDGKVWLGTHPGAHLTCYDPAADTWTDCGVQAPEPIIPDQHIWCRPHYVTSSGQVVCGIVRDPGCTVAYDPHTGATRVLAKGQELDRAPLAPSPVTRKIDATFRQDGCTYTVDGKQRTASYQPSVATDICGLHRGPDGCLYGATIISMHIFRYDPKVCRLEDLGRVGWGGGEVYDVIACGDKLYMGSYGGGYFAVYDPARPWNPRPDAGGEAADANPRNFGQLGQDMNRPFEYVVGPDGRIYIACRANYGLPGGGLARFDPRTEEKKVFRDLEQSVQCVACDGTWVYGGTSIRGGRGCIDVTREGRLFVWSPREERRVYQCVPESGAIAIGSLAVSAANGLVYGSTDTGGLFAYSPAERQVVRRWQLRSKGTPLMGVPEAYGIIHLTAGRDGDIYGVTQRDVFKVDVATDRVIYLDTPPIPDLYQIVEGFADGVFYIGARGHLLEYHLRDTPHFR